MPSNLAKLEAHHIVRRGSPPILLFRSVLAFRAIVSAAIARMFPVDFAMDDEKVRARLSSP